MNMRTLSQMPFGTTWILESDSSFPDIVHGTVYIPHVAAALLHTQAFQRLRELKQLGACSWVYPSATNSRFEHSLGVCHLANRFAQHLALSLPRDMEPVCPDDFNQVACAGLGHDLGHGPLSHLFETWINCKRSVGYIAGAPEWCASFISTQT